MDARPVRVSDTHLEIGFDPEFASHIERVKHPSSIRAIQRSVEDVLGRRLEIDFSVLEDSSPLPGDTLIGRGDDRDPPPAAPLDLDPSTIKAPENAQEASARDWVQDPGVRLVLEAFNGDVTDVRTG